MQNFDYHNHTRYVFGPGEHRNLGTLLHPYVRSRVLLHYGGGSIIRSGLLDTVRQSLNNAGIDFVELGGVKPNPSITLVRKGIELCRNKEVDLVLAVGGGSVIDSAKGIAVGVPNTGDVWELYSHKGSVPEQHPLPKQPEQRPCSQRWKMPLRHSDKLPIPSLISCFSSRLITPVIGFDLLQKHR